MIGYGDLARWFGEVNVIRPSATVLETLPLPDDAKTTLRELGLPAFVGEPLSLIFMSALTRDVRHRVEFERPGRSQEKLFRIGSENGKPALAICITESSGEVVLLRLEDSRRETFVNSNLRAFIESLYIVNRAQMTFEGDTDEEVATAVQNLMEELSRIDAHAFDVPDYFWPSFMVAMRDP